MLTAKEVLELIKDNPDAVFVVRDSVGYVPATGIKEVKLRRARLDLKNGLLDENKQVTRKTFYIW